MRYVAHLLIAVLCLLGVSFKSANTFPPQGTAAYSYSFENDFEGWSVTAMDVWGPSPMAWAIQRSQDMAKDGNTSAKFDLVNSNDAEKVFIERPFPVRPNQIYHVDVQYALASQYGGAAAFTIITGVLRNTPQTRDDLRPAFKDSTTKSNTEPGYEWINKKYEFAVRSDDQGVLHVIIGIWGTWEVHETYYIDDVHVNFTEKPSGSELFSFENDMEGWSPNATDLDFGSGTLQWSIVRVQPHIGGEDGSFAVLFDINNLNQKGKIWIERPFPVEPGGKYRVELEYAFHSDDSKPNMSNRIISGVFRSPPRTADDLGNAFQEDTSSDIGAGRTWGWLHKCYTFTIKSKKSSTVYLVIGIWGTHDDHLTYELDSVCVTLTRK